eukprot:1329366-Amorphochlora_amoeboformis.AAC.1
MLHTQMLGQHQAIRRLWLGFGVRLVGVKVRGLEFDRVYELVDRIKPGRHTALGIQEHIPYSKAHLSNYKAFLTVIGFQVSSGVRQRRGVEIRGGLLFSSYPEAGFANTMVTFSL